MPCSMVTAAATAKATEVHVRAYAACRIRAPRLTDLMFPVFLSVRFSSVRGRSERAKKHPAGARRHSNCLDCRFKAAVSNMVRAGFPFSMVLFGRCWARAVSCFERSLAVLPPVGWQS